MSKKNHSKNGLTAYRRLLGVAAQFWPMFIIGIIGTLLGAGVDSALAWMIKPVINEGFVARNTDFIRLLPAAVILVFILRGIAGFLSDYGITSVGRSVVLQFRQQVFQHLMRLPARFYDGQTSGQLLSALIYNIEQLAQATTDALLMLLQEGFLAIGLVIVMFTVSWQLTLLFLIVAPVMSSIVRVSSKRMRMLSGRVQDTMATVTHVAEESIEGYRVIRTFGGEQYEIDKFNKAAVRNRQQEMKVVVTDSLGSSGVQLVASFVVAMTMYVATVPSFNISAGSFAAMIAATLALLRPIRRLTQVNSRIQKGIAAAQSIFDLLDQAPEKDEGRVPLARCRGEIEYRQVTFRYPSSKRNVLDQISFQVKAGEVVALVGRSGSGKSTLVSLLPRFYDIEEGQILIDGHNVCDYRLADLRNQFALVSQNVTLFNDTIGRNIAYGRFSDVSEAELIAAAEAAHAMEFIRELPEGLNTLIGENGILLSGGQRQRIAIARAILKNAPILILDEATSSLDTEAERHIQTALEELMRGRTTLVIAHRLTTVEKADRIMVLDHGKIVETGTHRQLLELQGHYARLHAMQFKEDDEIGNTNLAEEAVA